MTNWTVILIAGLLLSALPFHKELSRKNRSYRMLRLIASALAIAAVLIMAYPRAAEQVDAVNTVILTDGFSRDSVERFLRLHPGSAVFSVTEEAAKDFLSAARPIGGWQAFIEKHTTDTLHVFGQGLSKEVLSMIDPQPFVFHRRPNLSGVSQVFWKQKIHEGEPLTIQGRYENRTAHRIKIVLSGFGAVMDSVLVDAGVQQDFSLATTPLHDGPALYEMFFIDGQDTLKKEPVPVLVQPTAPLQLLMLASSPDFENTYLKNHFSQRGYRVTLVSTTSSHKTSRQFLNMPAEQATPLTGAYLGKFDVIITDENTLQTMSRGEQEAVRSAVAEKGIGLLITIDTIHRASAFYSGYFPTAPAAYRKQAMRFRGWAEDSIDFLLKTEHPFHLRAAPGTKTLLEDEQMHVYAAAAMYGSGTIVASALQNSFSIALSGNKDAYQRLWSLLLRTAARKTYFSIQWWQSPFLPTPDKPVLLQAAAAGLPNASARFGSDTVYFKQDAALPFQWQGKYWPRHAGWATWPFPDQTVSTNQWYVYQPGDWQQPKWYNNRKATMAYAVHHPVSPITTETQGKERIPAPWTLLMALLFLGCCGFLWVEQKRG